MANIITKYLPLPGYRMISAAHLNDWAKQINDAFNGVTSAVFKGVFNGTVGATTPSTGSFTNVAVSGWLDTSVGNALTAAGTTRADALVLTASINNITTAAASTGAVLPSAATVGVGGEVIIINAGASPIKVYGAGSDTIDGTAGATGVTLTNAKRCIYFVTAANTFISAQLGVVSA